MTVTHGHVGVFCLFSCPSLMCVCVCARARACASTMWMKPEALPPTLSSLAVCDDPGAIPGFFLNSLALMHGPVIWIKIQEEFLTKWLGGEVRPQWRLLDSFWQGTLQQMCLIFFFCRGLDSGEQPVMLHWGTRAGYLVFQNQLPSRFIFWKRRKVVVIFATVNIEMHSNWD